MGTRVERGRHAEELACRYLTALGWTVLERNFRVRGGEIDIVADDGETVVFVEVRSRRAGGAFRPLATVGKVKQSRLIVAAHRWWAERAAGRAFSRFDVVTVEIDSRGSRVEHVRGAFVEQGEG